MNNNHERHSFGFFSQSEEEVVSCPTIIYDTPSQVSDHHPLQQTAHNDIFTSPTNNQQPLAEEIEHQLAADRKGTPANNFGRADNHYCNFQEPTLMNMENQSVHNNIEKGQPEHPDMKFGSKLSENEKTHSISRSSRQSNAPSFPCLGELEWRQISQIINKFNQKGATFYQVLLKDGREVFVDSNVEHFCPDLIIKFYLSDYSSILESIPGWSEYRTQSD